MKIIMIALLLSLSACASRADGKSRWGAFAQGFSRSYNASRGIELQCTPNGFGSGYNCAQ